MAPKTGRRIAGLPYPRTPYRLMCLGVDGRLQGPIQVGRVSSLFMAAPRSPIDPLFVHTQEFWRSRFSSTHSFLSFVPCTAVPYYIFSSFPVPPPPPPPPWVPTSSKRPSRPITMNPPSSTTTRGTPAPRALSRPAAWASASSP